MWMNQSEIEYAYSRTHACPNVRKGVRLLYKLMQAVNAQSDGWPYWKAPAKAAEPLMDLLQAKAGKLHYDTRGTITDAELAKVIRPIKAMVTKQQKVQANFGNKFEFDVDAAMQEEKPTPVYKIQIFENDVIIDTFDVSHVVAKSVQALLDKLAP